MDHVALLEKLKGAKDLLDIDGTLKKINIELRTIKNPLRRRLTIVAMNSYRALGTSIDVLINVLKRHVKSIEISEKRQKAIDAEKDEVKRNEARRNSKIN